MAVPSVPSDDSDGNDWTASKVNVIYDHLGWHMTSAPLFLGIGYTGVGVAPTGFTGGMDVTTATNTTVGFGTGGTFANTPNINVGSWTVQGSDSDPESLVVPESGYYRISVYVEWEDNAANQRVAWLLKNGSLVSNMGSGLTYGSTAGMAANSFSGLIDLTAGDQLDMRVWQNSGSTLEIRGYLHAEWVRAT